MCTSRKLKMPENYFSLNMSSPSSGLPSLFPSHIRHSSVLVNFVDFIFMFIETNAIAQCYFVSIFKSIFSSGCRESLFLNWLWVPNLPMWAKSKQEIKILCLLHDFTYRSSIRGCTMTVFSVNVLFCFY